MIGTRAASRSVQSVFKTQRELVAALGLLDLAGLGELDRVVETVGRAIPAFAATSPAVIASPPASAASTEALVAPGGVRPLVVDVAAG